MKDRLRHEASEHTKAHKARRYTVTWYSPKYTRVTFWKDRRKLNFDQVATKYGYSQLHMHKPDENQISKQRNPIGRSMTTVSAALSPRSILQPPSFYFALVSARKEIRCVLTLRRLMSFIYIYIYIYAAPILDVSRSHTTTQHSR